MDMVCFLFGFKKCLILKRKACMCTVFREKRMFLACLKTWFPSLPHKARLQKTCICHVYCTCHIYIVCDTYVSCLCIHVLSLYVPLWYCFLHVVLKRKGACCLEKKVYVEGKVCVVLKKRVCVVLNKVSHVRLA